MLLPLASGRARVWGPVLVVRAYRAQGLGFRGSRLGVVLAYWQPSIVGLLECSGFSIGLSGISRVEGSGREAATLDADSAGMLHAWSLLLPLRCSLLITLSSKFPRTTGRGKGVQFSRWTRWTRTYTPPQSLQLLMVLGPPVFGAVLM